MVRHDCEHELDIEGVSRPAFSAKETEVLEYLTDQARAAGLSVSFDAGQNAVFSLPEDADAAQYVLVGSHVDSVPMGGNFDGLAGVLAGCCAYFAPKHPIRGSPARSK